MATLDELLVRIDASTELLRRELNKGDGDVRRFEQRTTKSVERIDQRFSRLGRGVRSALAAFGVGLSITGLTRFTQSAVAAGDAIGKAAKTAGIGAEQLQELRFAFGQLAGTTDREVDESLRRFNRRLGLAIRGTGEATKTYREMGITFRTTGGQIRETEDVLEEILRELAQIENGAVRAAQASQLFGEDAGPRLAAALGEGTDAMEALREATPGVLSDEQVAKAEALTDAFSRMAAEVGGAVKGAFIDASDALLRFFEVPETFRTIQQLETQISEVEDRLARRRANPRGGQPRLSAIADDESFLADLQRRLDAARGTQTLALITDEEIDEAVRRSAARGTGLRQARATRRRVESGLADPSRPSDVLETIDPSVHVQRGLERGEAIGEARRTAREIGESLTDVADEVEDRWASLGQSMQFSLRSSLADAFLGIEQDWGQMLQRMLADWASSAILSGIGSAIGGPFGAFLGGVSGRQHGGPVTAGRPYLVGEAGPELFVPSFAGKIQPNVGGLTINVDARGATDPALTAAAVRTAVQQSVQIADQRMSARLRGLFRPGMA